MDLWVRDGCPVGAPLRAKLSGRPEEKANIDPKSMLTLVVNGVNIWDEGDENQRRIE